MQKTLSVPETHQKKIALSTLKMHEVGARIMGGMDHRQAVTFLRSIGYMDENIRAKLVEAGHDVEAIERFMKQ
jgi:hypothetical protein